MTSLTPLVLSSVRVLAAALLVPLTLMVSKPCTYWPLSAVVLVALLPVSLWVADNFTFNTGRFGMATLPIKPARIVCTLVVLRGWLLLKLAWLSASPVSAPSKKATPLRCTLPLNATSVGM